MDAKGENRTRPQEWPTTRDSDTTKTLSLSPHFLLGGVPALASAAPVHDVEAMSASSSLFT